MTQGELEQIPLAFEKIMSALEIRVMADIVERIRINKDITSTADWQIQRLYQLGESKRTIKKWIKESLSLSNKEIKKLYHGGLYNEYIRNKQLYKAKGRPWVPFEENRELQSLIQAIQEQTKGEFKNITQSLGFAIKDKQTGKIIQSPLREFYVGTLDSAVMDITTGVFDYNTVLNRTINQMTNSGLRTVDYDSGHSNRVEVAARRAVMTGFSQVQSKINQQVAKDLDTDSYEVSWHGGARPTHQVWQGKVYTHRELEDICELGSVTGLLGANCYHDYNAFIPGVSVRTYTDEWLEEQNTRENTPKEYDGKEYTMYEALQQQRKMERLMRKQRQDIKLLQDGEGNEDDIIAVKSRYQSSINQYTNFSKKMELPEQRERVFQDGLKGTFSTKNTVETKMKSGLAAGKHSQNNKNHKPVKLIRDIDSNNIKEVKSELKKYEKEIVQSDIENAIVITKNGKVYHCFGDLNGVYPDIDLKEELKGSYVTHNHPAGSNNEYSFSNNDINLFKENNLKILRGIDENYIYELTRNSIELDEHLSLFELTDKDGRHEMVIDIAQMHGFGYRRWKRDRSGE